MIGTVITSNFYPDSTPDIIKYAVIAITFLWAGFKVYIWVKDIREKDLASLKFSVSEVKTSIDSVKQEISAQTAEIVSELREQRQDFRTFYSPQFNLKTLSTSKVAVAKKKKIN